MNEVFSGVTVQLFASETVAILRSPGLPGLTCTPNDVWQLEQMFNRNISGTITLANGSAIQVILRPEVLEIRQDNQLLLHVTPECKPGTKINDISALLYKLSSLIQDMDDSTVSLQPTYGFFLQADLDNGGPSIEVWNNEPHIIGDLTRADLPVLRERLTQGVGIAFLTNLVVEVTRDTVTLQPDNRPKQLEPGHRQTVKLQEPLELTPAQAWHLVNDADFHFNFSV